LHDRRQARSSTGGGVGRPTAVWDRAGNKDLNDHDELRHDPMIAVLADKLDAPPEGLRATRSAEGTTPPLLAL
jgi:hypothetical protein